MTCIFYFNNMCFREHNMKVISHWFNNEQQLDAFTSLRAFS